MQHVDAVLKLKETMRKDQFTECVLAHLQNLYDLVNSEMQKRSDKSEDCQQHLLLNSLFCVEMAINGVEAADMKTIRSKG